MGSLSLDNKPHAVCIPYPAQGHIGPMLKLAKLLHQRGFHITFVNTEYNHKRLLKSRGPESLNGLSSFQFKTIPDGLPPTDSDATQDIPTLCASTTKTCLAPFRDLILKLNHTSSSNVPPVTCIVSDGVMSFTLDAAKEFGIPEVLFWTTSACGFLAYAHYRDLVEKEYTPLKGCAGWLCICVDAPVFVVADVVADSDSYLDTVIDWIPGMQGISLKDIPSFVRTTNPDEFMIKFVIAETERARKANAIVLNTFDALEHDVLAALGPMLPPVYSIGPLNLLQNEVTDHVLKSIGSNLWKEEYECMKWLDSKAPDSVVYVNFGSITVMTSGQLIEFAWGLANSKRTFLWVIRPDLVSGDTAILPSEFITETKDRGFLASWCPQEQVLTHPSIGGFLTHSGWNSTIESISGGVPMICWPFFAEQQTNCRYSCVEWGIGMEINSDVKRDDVENLVRELMEGVKGKEMKKKVAEWKKLAEDATTRATGSSYQNVDKVINEILLCPSY